MQNVAGSHRPKNITVDHPAGVLRIAWQDGHESEYSLRWLRANCPCATCREERRAIALDADPLRLSSGPLPSTEIAAAELVGNYAIRLDWRDGHSTGIYTFAALRESCPCAECLPEGASEPPPLLPD